MSVCSCYGRLHVVLRAKSGFSTDAEFTEVASNSMFVSDLTRDLPCWNNLYRIGDSVYRGLSVWTVSWPGSLKMTPKERQLR